MDFNYSEGLLLSDLLCLYYKTNEIKYLEELKLRMMFCGYTNEEISEFIIFETNILYSRKNTYVKNILKTYYIIGKNTSKNIFLNPNSYMFDPEKDNKKTLMISELISIIDEAIFLTYSPKIKTYNAKNEIYNLSLETSSNWLFFEFKNRLEYICRCANHIINGPKSTLFSKKIDILYDNEMQICLKRWNVDVSSRNFVPYTQQYFD